MVHPRISGLSGRPGRTRLVAALAVPSLVLPLLATTAAGREGEATGGAAGEAAGAGAVDGSVWHSTGLDDVEPGSYEITLVTGDTVMLTAAAGGRFETSVEDPSAFTTEAGPGGVYVVPDAALPAVEAGRVDRELFNVSYLAANGYADAEADRLPVIVEYPANRSSRLMRREAEELPASRLTWSLESIDAAALTVSKDRAEVFWSAIAGAADIESVPEAGAGAEGRSATGTMVEGGLAKVWLDRRVEAVLDESVPLIGAPEAWAAGYDGAGVTVAVLDTGIDADHPDVAEKIVASRSFVPGVDSAADGHGHGTHVAATVAGSGAASDGRHVGVAPGADLVVGKVLSDAGTGSASQIIDAMEWAAVEQDADVVSMSLGGDPTDGTDPLSVAVNELTASTGALFVIAAGNDGPGAETIGAPGAADAALTVAATDKNDGLAGFSSRGPRVVDLALKPDIAAPGVQITAARAVGTALCQGVCVQPGDGPVDEHYTSASGTSMATPHVSAAAAILKQRFPDWDAEQLKSALMSTSSDAGHSVYEQGAGRVDVARVISQEVFATTVNLDYGIVEASGEQPAEPVNKQVTYTNLSDEPVTLTLAPALGATGGEQTPGSVLTVDDTVTVPAGGTAGATVTLDVTGLGHDVYSGAVVATDEASGAQLTTPVGLIVEPSKVTLTIRTLDRDGQPIGNLPLEHGGDLGGYAPSRVNVSAVDVPRLDSVTADVALVERGVEKVRVAPGTYNVRKDVRWWDDETEENYVNGVLFDPQVSVTEDTVVTLDARAAVPVTFTVPQRAEGRSDARVRVERSRWDGRLLTSVLNAHYVTPTERVTTGTFRVAFTQEYANPQLSMTVRRPERLALHPVSRMHADQGLAFGGDGDGGVNPVTHPAGWVPFPSGKHTLEVVDAGFGDPEDIAGLDLDGKLALLGWGDDRRGSGDVADSLVWTDRIDNVQQAGAVGVILFPNPPAGYERHASFTAPRQAHAHWPEAGEKEYRIPTVEVKRSEGEQLLEMLEEGSVTVDVQSDPNVRYQYHLHPHEDQQIPDDLHYAFTKKDLAQVETSVHGAEPLERARYSVSSWQAGTFFNSSLTIKFAVPKPSVTEYVGPLASDVVYTRRLTFSGTGGTRWAEPEVFDQPTRNTLRWNAVPAVPGAASVQNLHVAAFELPPGAPKTGFEYCAMCRQGNTFLPWHQGIRGTGTYRGSTSNFGGRLFTEDGEQIPRTPRNGLPVFNLPEESATYRLVQNDQGVTTTWTFTSAAPERDTVQPMLVCAPGAWTDPCHSEPFVFLDYDLGNDLRLDNTVRTAGAHRFTVTANRGPTTEVMPKLSGLKLWTSVDGGEQWEPARVIPRGRATGEEARFDVVALYPKLSENSGAVSLKAEAWDADGNRIEQVVPDAFELIQRP